MTFRSDSNLHSQAQNIALDHVYSLCNPAFTESSYVSCHTDAFISTARRLSDYQYYCDDESDWNHWLVKTMDPDASAALQRTASHHSNTSRKSSRSQTVRGRPKKYASYMSSSASSVSDKSLTSFPSFSSPESPKDHPLLPSPTGGLANGVRKGSDPTISTVESLTVSTPSQLNRTGLFDDAPLSTQHVPGSIHHANDDHIERLIARNGAVALVRQLAEDLAQRDAQMASLRRKTEERERALRKIILECGLSNLDLETRLRVVEGERSLSVAHANPGIPVGDAGLEDMMNDAMNENVLYGGDGLVGNDATIRAVAKLKSFEDRPPNTQKGWKDYLWGGTSRKTSRASSINEDTVIGPDTRAVSTVVNTTSPRKSVLQNGLFQAPDTTSNWGRGSMHHSGVAGTPSRQRKPSGLATLALKLVAGSTLTGRDAEGTSGNRGRANSTGTAPGFRAPSTASARTTMSATTVPLKPGPKEIPGARRPTVNASKIAARHQQDRWDTMGESPQKSTIRSESYGPVEMDQILPLEAQPPTVAQIYNNPFSQDFLTDRFGFIYDQRRKKRQREAAEKMQKSRRRVEMLSSGRSGISVDDSEIFDDSRPDTPTSLEGEEGKPGKRWQDYLKIATFPTELLSHTPSGAVPAFEVMEGGELPPRSPGITTEERGFLPSASTFPIQPAVTVTSEDALISKPSTNEPSPLDLPQEDAEPVKLLLKQLGEVHDSLQRDKTVRWNEFLRKVRAERKRDGEAAKAALAADNRSQKPITVMPEATLTDGEIIGVAGLGNKGKVGRAKWKEFKSLLLGGIPVAYRAKIWAECSGASTLRMPGYYEDLIARSEEDDDPSIVSQIEMDINRTLTDNIFFRKGPGVGKLNEVLLAYSRRNTEVGYCQGMNLITACLLLIMPTAEDAFWVLTSIIENILPRGYYDHSLLASRADQQVLRQYVSEILPKLSAHLDDLSIELEALTFQWFLSVFTDCLSAEALFRVWDVVFCTNDGSTFLFQVALALLKLNESQLLQCTTPAGIYTYINHQMTNHAISIDGLIHASEGLRKVVKREEVESRRTKAIEAEKDLIKQREARNAARKAERAAASASAASETSLAVQQVAPETSRASSAELSGAYSEEELAVQEPLPVEEDVVQGFN